MCQQPTLARCDEKISNFMEKGSTRPVGFASGKNWPTESVPKQYVIYDFNSFMADSGGYMGLILGIREFHDWLLN